MSDQINEQNTIDNNINEVNVENNFTPQTIYYCYRKDDGRFMGSGTPYHDDDVVASTTDPCPPFNCGLGSIDGERELPYYINGEWIIKKIQD
jgi:hypothetical protein